VLKGGHGYLSPDLFTDFILIAGLYIGIPIVWYFLLKKYQFNLKEVFVLSGIFGVFAEQDFAVLLTFNPLAYLYVFLVYGSLITIPFILNRDSFEFLKRKNNKRKYFVAFFSQFLAYLFGFMWAAIMTIFIS